MISWQDGALFSTEYGDIYYSRDGGCEEKEEVFFRGNGLEERWRDWESEFFVIGELGFGAGISFLATWCRWREMFYQNPRFRLIFTSSEKHLLPREVLSSVITNCPRLSSCAKELLSLYNVPAGGFHSLLFENGWVNLILLVGDSLEMWKQVGGQVHAWYLDGFSPAKNESMWSPDLMQVIAEKTYRGGTFATYTVAAPVREALGDAGFVVEKIPGFGKKRHMLRGHKPRSPMPIISVKGKKAAVVGAGVAGCLLAHSLVRRGWVVELFERENECALQGSGNRMGILHPQFSAESSAMSRINVAGYLFFVRHARDTYGLQEFRQRGLFIEPKSAKERERIEKAIRSHELGEMFVHEVGESFYLPFSGQTHPAEICERTIERRNVHFFGERNVESFGRNANGWTLNFSGGESKEYETVFLANAVAARSFPGVEWLPLREVKGQVIYVPASVLNEKPQVPVTADTYLAQLNDDEYLLGATFEKTFSNTDFIPQKNTELWQRLGNRFKKEVSDEEILSWPGRTGMRAVTYDRLPLVGNIPDKKEFEIHYEKLLKGALADNWPDGDAFLPNLYIFSGLGARGLIYAPLLAEVLAAQVSDEILPVPFEDARFLNPGRYLIRNVKRQNGHEIRF